MAERERIVEFIRELGRKAAGHEEGFPFGVAHFHDELPRVWSRNYLLAERNLEGATVPLLAAEADRILGGAGLAHRKVEVNDEEVGARLEPGFKSLGWDVHCDVLMVACGEPDRSIDTSHVEEVGADELEAAWAQGIRTEPYGGDQEVVRQLVANKRVLMDAIDRRFFGFDEIGRVYEFVRPASS